MLRQKGFLCGVCHPNEDYALLKEAHLGWVRFDVPMPFGPDGSIRQDYLAFRQRAMGYRREGIKVMAVTPFPCHFEAVGVDVRTEEGEVFLRKVADFLITDLQNIVGGFQITNEPGVAVFTRPLTQMKECVRFIGITLEQMYPKKGNLLIGYNSANAQADLHSAMGPWLKYCDYVGVDIYIGCFGNTPGYVWYFDAILRYLWSLTRKPILLQEFGYISGGQPKTQAEKLAILRSYGVSSETEAEQNIDTFMTRIPPRMADYVRQARGMEKSEYADELFRSMYKNHLYRELPPKTKIRKYPHTPQGQANFFRDLLARFHRFPFVIGANVYCWSDAAECGYCSQADCPTETRWGLVDQNGKPKPSFYAVKEFVEKTGEYHAYSE